MNIWEYIELSFRSILSNRIRSVLTILGIVIGTASVIAVFAIGRGGQATILSELDKLGINVVAVKARPIDMSEKEFIRIEDAADIKKNVGNIRNMTPVFTGTGVLKSRKKSREVTLIGTGSEYRKIYDMELIYGRWLSESDVQSEKKVIAIDNVLSERLLGKENSTGETIRLKLRNGQYDLKIIGIVKNTNEIYENIFGEQFPSFVYLPVTILQKFYNTVKIDQIIISSTDREYLEDTGTSAVRLLERKHGRKDIYYAENTVKQKEQVNRIISILTYVIGSIGAISLVVGGIGVMNIMLVSVAERVREIGIKKAVGAKNRDILFQFLMEAVVITFSGGVAGICLGLAVSALIVKAAGISGSVSLLSVMAAIISSICIGVVCGVYPASKAAKLDPIKALRQE